MGMSFIGSWNLVLYPRGMKDGGWHYDSLKPWDEVTIFYHPVKGEGHAGLFMRVEFPDGHVLPTSRQGTGDN